MKKKPFVINFIALCYFVAPIINIWQVAWINHWPLTGPRSVFLHFSQVEWALLALCPIVAFGIMRVTKWGYFLFLGFSALLIMRTSLLYFKNPVYSLYLVLLFHVFIVGTVGYFLQKHIIAPYFNPKLKWWERDERFKVDLIAKIKVDDRFFEGQILDVSVSGCFLRYDKNLKLGDLVWINTSLNNEQFSVMGNVMWISRKEPQGYGLMFVGTSKEDKRTIQRMVDYLKRSAKNKHHDSGSHPEQQSRVV